MKLRNIKVIQEQGSINIEYKAKDGEKSLLNLINDKIHFPNSCHGNGTCGKCKVKMDGTTIPVTETERKRLSKSELEQGIRLACKIRMEDLYNRVCSSEIMVEILGDNEEDIVVEALTCNEVKKDNDILLRPKEQDYFIAIDIGTTTVAMALVNTGTGEVCETYASINHQRAYGADVISRIQASNDGKGLELKQIIEEDLWKGIQELTRKAKEVSNINRDDESLEGKNDARIISKIIIAGNPTMIHLLMGYSCETLGKYPFKSEYLGQINCFLSDCLKNTLRQNCDIEACVAMYKKQDTLFHTYDVYEEYENIPVTILPGFSAFVGGDIVADIIASEAFHGEEINLLIDLGTNGEMVLGNKDRLLTTSTAAGPAFEGGSITCGTASIPGSISAVKIQNRKAIVKTIQDKLPPIGICGTGLVSAVAELIRNKMIDMQGNLQVPYHAQGYPLWIHPNGERIALYQKDIREFQMAKAAIRSGIDILIKNYGCNLKDINKIYIAGGFGTYLKEEDALDGGLLPREFAGKTETIGNGALKGSICIGKGCDNVSPESQCYYLTNMIKGAEYLPLSQEKDFQDYYIKQMHFDCK